MSYWVPIQVNINLYQYQPSRTSHTINLPQPICKNCQARPQRKGNFCGKKCAWAYKNKSNANINTNTNTYYIQPLKTNVSTRSYNKCLSCTAFPAKNNSNFCCDACENAYHYHIFGHY